MKIFILLCPCKNQSEFNGILEISVCPFLVVRSTKLHHVRVGACLYGSMAEDTGPETAAAFSCATRDGEADR
jgi:hypothetical protein